MVADDRHLEIGSLVFDGMDQIDLTRSFEVFSRIPNATYRLYGARGREVRDVKGLRLLADGEIADAPALETQLIAVPRVAWLGSASAELVRELRAELETPPANALVRDLDARSERISSTSRRLRLNT